MVAGETAPERVLCLLVESCKIGAYGGCFASTTKTARNSVSGGEIIENVGPWGGSICIYIYMCYIYIYICFYMCIYIYIVRYMILQEYGPLCVDLGLEVLEGLV